jgi:hypothetical protein
LTVPLICLNSSIDRTVAVVLPFLVEGVLGCFFEAKLELLVGCVLKVPNVPMLDFPERMRLLVAVVKNYLQNKQTVEGQIDADV